MNVFVSFEPEGQSGLVASGTYLWDAAKRLGASVPEKCSIRKECDECFFMVKEGMDSLSPVTDDELKHLGEERLNANERLACHAQIIGPDDILISIPQDEKPEVDSFEKFVKEFGKITIDKKYAVLYELEQAILKDGKTPDMSLIENQDVAAMFLKDYVGMTQAEKLGIVTKLEGSASVYTALSVLNLPWTVGEKVLDFIAVRGRKIHDEERDSERSTQKQEEPESKFTEPE